MSTAGELPLKKKQAEFLLDAMCDVKDPRDNNKSIPSTSILTLMTMAVMSGANSVKAILEVRRDADHAAAKGPVLSQDEGQDRGTAGNRNRVSLA